MNNTNLLFINIHINYIINIINIINKQNAIYSYIISKYMKISSNSETIK